MELSYTTQREIDEGIVALLGIIGCPARGRIEILDGDQQVIEFESIVDGKWQRTGWHRRTLDHAVSIFPEFRLSPVIAKIKEFRDQLEKLVT